MNTTPPFRGGAGTPASPPTMLTLEELLRSTERLPAEVKVSLLGVVEGETVEVTAVLDRTAVIAPVGEAKQLVRHAEVLVDPEAVVWQKLGRAAQARKDARETGQANSRRYKRITPFNDSDNLTQDSAEARRQRSEERARSDQARKSA